jgi:hypothetical protein
MRSFLQLQAAHRERAEPLAGGGTSGIRMDAAEAAGGTTASPAPAPAPARGRDGDRRRRKRWARANSA